jgi:endonuclease/exonuclease/phosphatase family metal-dependent hydrolase
VFYYSLPLFGNILRFALRTWYNGIGDTKKIVCLARLDSKGGSCMDNKKPLTLISLNIWGGSVLPQLLKFISDHQNVDIFCLQEVYHNARERISTDDAPVCLNIHERIGDILHNHAAYFKPVVDGIYGLSMFIKKDLLIEKEGHHAIHTNPAYIGRGPTHSRILQWASVQHDNNRYAIVNVHGLWNGKGKNDSPERLVQSHNIRKCIETLETPLVVCGDFNLNPTTQSLALIQDGMQNLITQHNVTSTRSSLYTKPEKFADYILTSKDIGVSKFKVMSDEVSDHLPLFLEFN